MECEKFLHNGFETLSGFADFGVPFAEDFSLADDASFCGTALETGTGAADTGAAGTGVADTGVADTGAAGTGALIADSTLTMG